MESEYNKSKKSWNVIRIDLNLFVPACIQEQLSFLIDKAEFRAILMPKDSSLLKNGKIISNEILRFYNEILHKERPLSIGNYREIKLRNFTEFFLRNFLALGSEAYKKPNILTNISQNVRQKMEQILLNQN